MMKVRIVIEQAVDQARAQLRIAGGTGKEQTCQLAPIGAAGMLPQKRIELLARRCAGISMLEVESPHRPIRPPFGHPHIRIMFALAEPRRQNPIRLMGRALPGRIWNRYAGADDAAENLWMLARECRMSWKLTWRCGRDSIDGASW